MVSLKLAAILLIPSVIAGVVKRQDDSQILAYLDGECGDALDHIVPPDACDNRFSGNGEINSIKIPEGVVCTLYANYNCQREGPKISGPRCLELDSSADSYQCAQSQ
ncbi:hypothetical protein H101_03433 [Trichophyton interdigitale H6]|nr:hypothetical protein H101_03433 [Trichophyton interdigitale H6]